MHLDDYNDDNNDVNGGDAKNCGVGDDDRRGKMVYYHMVHQTSSLNSHF